MTHDLRALTVNRSKQSDPALSLLDEAREGQVSQGYIALASLVLEHAPEWVEPIEAGTKSLIDAYEIAAQRQKQALAESLPYELTRSKSMPEWEELLPICYGLQDLFRTFLKKIGYSREVLQLCRYPVIGCGRMLLLASSDAAAAKRFLAKALGRQNHPVPRVINTDGHSAYPPAIAQLKNEGTLDSGCEHRPVPYLNNVLEQDHRAIKRRVKASQGFRSFWAAWRTLASYEVST